MYLIYEPAVQHNTNPYTIIANLIKIRLIKQLYNLHKISHFLNTIQVVNKGFGISEVRAFTVELISLAYGRWWKNLKVHPFHSHIDMLKGKITRFQPFTANLVSYFKTALKAALQFQYYIVRHLKAGTDFYVILHVTGSVWTAVTNHNFTTHSLAKQCLSHL